MIQHDSRKQRQLKYLVKRLNALLQKSEENLEKEINNLVSKIKHLVSQLNGIISTTRMKKMLGAAALLIGVSFVNTANAQYFAYPVTNPFSITPGYTNGIQSVNLIDIDNDGDLDLFTDSLTYGYYSYPINFNFQENIGTATNPNFKSPVLNPFNLTLMPNDTAYYKLRHFVDLDGDGDFDILSNVAYSGFYSLISKYRYHENIGTSSAPNFTSAVINPFGLQTSTQIEFSSIGDIDNDGDFDLINSWGGYYGGGSTFIENTGSNSAPMFSSPQANVFGLPSLANVVIPALSDLDSDGDLDLIYAEYSFSSNSGQFVYHENTGTSSQAQFASPASINPYGLNPSAFGSIPTFEFKDLDNDGDLDLLAGTYEETSYFENVGIQQPVTYECINYSCIDPGTGSGTYATLSACQTSCIAPASYDCDWGSNNCYDPGDGTGYYTTYSDCMLDCTPPPTWNCITPGQCDDPGDGSGWYWSLQDCLNDCQAIPTWNCDAISGNCYDPGDGTGLYASLTGCQANCTPASVENTEVNGLRIYPNPVNNTLHISSDRKIDRIEICDNLGRIIFYENNPESQINVEYLENGVYSISIICDDSRIIKKFTK